MSSASLLAPLIKLRPRDAAATPASGDAAASLALYGLETACNLLGGMNAWVTRHGDGKSHMVMVLKPDMEIDPLLNSILVNSAANTHRRPVMVMPWKQDTLLCASLSAQPEADGCAYMLGMIFTGAFVMTERLAGVVDGLRCSLQVLISRHLSWERLKTKHEAQEQTVTCCCCRRMHTAEQGWMHWDDFRFLKTGRGSSHTVCEQCALALYGDVLHGKV